MKKKKGTNRRIMRNVKKGKKVKIRRGRIRIIIW